MSALSEMLEQLTNRSSELAQILGVTLLMSFFSTTISALLGIPLGVLLGSRSFFGKKLIMRFTHTLMGVPPVVAGLVVFLLLSRRGPLGSFGLLFTVRAMVIAQVLLITPVVIVMTAAASGARANSLMETTRGLGIGRRKELLLIVNECRAQLVSVVLTGFGRSIAEVGAVSMVGGNIANKTRVMTTAILLETNKGDFNFALLLGVLLLAVAFVVNALAQRYSEDWYA